MECHYDADVDRAQIRHPGTLPDSLVEESAVLECRKDRWSHSDEVVGWLDFRLCHDRSLDLILAASWAGVVFRPLFFQIPAVSCPETAVGSCYYPVDRT